jgi:hypothetical protein
MVVQMPSNVGFRWSREKAWRNTLAACDAAREGKKTKPMIRREGEMKEGA